MTDTAPPTVELRFGDCLAVLRELPDSSVDAIITDPPYGLAEHKPATITAALVAWTSGDREHVPNGKGFMGRDWDAFVPPPAVWDECLRVLKPGGHLAAFAGSRTYDLMGMSIRLAGFEIRDGLQWLYGSGMPKGQNVGKAIDKMRDDKPAARRVAAFLAEAAARAGMTAGDLDVAFGFAGSMAGQWMTQADWVLVPRWEQWESLREMLGFGGDMDAEVWRLNGRKGTPGEAWERREVIGEHKRTGKEAGTYGAYVGDSLITAPATPEAARWEGWNTSLKPSQEPIVLARKPLAGTATNVLGMVESALRDRGVDGGIRWATRPASGAAKRSRTNSSGTTGPLPTAATSARTVSGSATQLTGSATGSSTATTGEPGATETPSTPAPTSAARTPSCATQCSPHTAGPAPAATSDSGSSSLSTTSTGEAPTTGVRSDATSTHSSAGRGSPRGTESFAGIATGLTGSRATVRIDRLSDGTFVWPDGLPLSVPGAPTTVAATVLAHGTGAMNIDATKTPEGRWPANVLLTHAPECHDPGECAPGCPVAELDAQSGNRPGFSSQTDRAANKTSGEATFGAGLGIEAGFRQGYDDEGGASRFFPSFRYQAKAPASERPKIDGKGWPTVKPQGVMRWLVRLLTPPGGTVLDPFAGTSATLQAARDEGLASIGIERDEFAYLLSCQRLELPEIVPAVVRVEIAPVEVVEVAELAPAAEVVEVPVEIDPVEVVEVPVLHDLDDVLRESGIDPVLVAIAAVESIDALVALITAADRATWTDEHTAAVLARQAELESLAA